MAVIEICRICSISFFSWPFFRDFIHPANTDTRHDKH